MSTDVTLTSYVLNPWDGTYSSTNKIALSYANLDFVPSASDSYKSTSGDVFKVYVAGIRIYRTDDENYASGSGFLEDGDSTDGTTLNGLSGNIATDPVTAVGWNTATSNDVWSIDTANQKIFIDTSNITSSALYGSNGKNISFTSGTTIITLTRAVQDLKTPSIDFSNASILTEQDLDNSAKNVFHAAQQAIISTENAMLYSEGTDAYSAAQPGTSNAKRIADVATPTATTDAANKAYVDGGSDVQTVAGLSSEVALLGTTAMATATTGHIPVVAGMKDDIETVAGDAVDIGAVAGKEDEIGRLGTADAVADMAILGTADIVADMAILATTDVVADMNTLGTADVVADMNTLATADVVADMNTLGTADIVSDMNTLGTSSNVTNMDTVATNIGSVNTVAAANNAITTINSNIASVTSFGDTYHLTGDSTPSSNVTTGDLWFDTNINTMKVYDGSSWASASSSIATVASVTEYTGSQATNSKWFALTHDVGLQIVWLNGVRQVQGSDYYSVNSNSSTTNMTSGAPTHIYFLSNVATTDVISAMAFGQIDSTTVVPISGGTFTGNVVIEGSTTHNTSSNTFTMPTTRGTDTYVLTRDDTAGTGGTTWKETITQPVITSVTGEINEDTNTTLTVAGSGFSAGMTLKLFNASTSADITGHTSLSYSGSTSPLTVTIPSATTNITAGLQVKLQISKSGLTAQSDAITVSEDPNWTTNAGTVATIADTLGTSQTVATLAASAGAGGGTLNYASDDSTLNTSYFALNLTSGVITTHASTALTGLTGSGNHTESFNANVKIVGESTKNTVRAFNIIITASPTGGNITDYSGYRVHTFLIGDTGEYFTPSASMNVDYLIIAGGGSGGAHHGGGGGAGGFLTAASFGVTAQAYEIIVGDGGAAVTSTSGGIRGNAGGNSSFAGIVATGGGAGGAGGDTTMRTGGPGGSGGGAGGDGGTAGGTATKGVRTASPVQGNDGGYHSDSGSPYRPASGGGAGAVGGNTGSAGGAGLANSYRTGSSVTYAGGGGGSATAQGGAAIAGGSGGGGGGAASASVNGTVGTDDTGSGGGGGFNSGTSGAGGSGIVVIRYAV